MSVYSAGSGALVAQTVTDSSGHYSFKSDQLPNGSYRVKFDQADWWSGATAFADATDVTIASGSPVTINEALHPVAGAINGRVTAGGSNLGDVHVAAYAKSTGDLLGTATSRANGTYTVPGLYAGDYLVSFSKDGYTTRYSGSAISRSTAPTVSVSSGLPTTGIDTDLDPGSTATGTIDDATYLSASDTLKISAVLANGDTAASTLLVTPSNNFTLNGLDHLPYTFVISGPSIATLSVGPFTPPAGGNLDLGTLHVRGAGCNPTIFAPGADLSGRDLHGISLIGCDLHGANLSNTNLTDVDLTSANLTGANLTGATLTGTILTAADLTNANLTNALLDQTVLHHTDLTGIATVGLVSTNLDAYEPTLSANMSIAFDRLFAPGVDLSGALLTHPGVSAFTDLSGVDLHGANLQGATLSGIDLDGSNLAGADLSAATVIATFDDADLQGVDAHGATIKDESTFRNANLTGVDLSGAHLGQDGFIAWGAIPDFSGALLNNANLTNATLSGVVLADTDLSTVTFSGATFTSVTSHGLTGSATGLPAGWSRMGDALVGPGAHATDANLDGVDLSGASLTPIDFSRSTMIGAVLTNATLGDGSSSSTCWFTNANLTNASLAGAHLSFCGFAGSDLTTTGAAGAHLDHVGFVGARITDADLSGVDLSQSTFGSAILTEVDLAGATIQGTEFHGAYLGGIASGGVVGTPVTDTYGDPTITTHWHLIDGYLVGPTAHLAGVDLSGQSMIQYDFDDADLTNANLSNTTLTDASMVGTHLDGTALVGATFTGVTSGGITGVPASMPTRAGVVNGYLAARHANLSQADFTGQSLAGLDLTNCNLISADLTNADLTGTTLTYAQLQQATIDGADFTSANFFGAASAGLRGTPAAISSSVHVAAGYFVGPYFNLTSAALPNLDFDGYNLSHANLIGADLTGTSLRNANLSGARFDDGTGHPTTLTDTDLDGANLSGAVIGGAITGGITGTPSALPTRAGLADGYLLAPNANLPGADLTGAALDGLDLSNADLTGATLTGVSMEGTTLTGAVLKQVRSGGITGTPQSLATGWFLLDGYLIGSTSNYAGSGADLSGATFHGADLSGRNLFDANLTNADLSDANLTGANLTAAKLVGANLSGADLSGATLNGTAFRDAIVSGTTFDQASLQGVSSGGLEGVPAATASGTRVVRGYFAGPGAGLAQADLSGIDLNGLDLTNAYLGGVHSGAMTGTALGLPTGWIDVNGYLVGPHADLSGADLTGADLSSVSLSGVNLADATVQGANLATSLDFVTTGGLVGTPASLPPGWVLAKGFLIGPSLYNLSYIDLSGADLHGVSLTGVYLGGVDLTGANLQGADLGNSHLENSLLTNADLRGANLGDAYLDGANLDGAQLDGATLPSPYLAVRAVGVTGTPADCACRVVNGTLLAPDVNARGAPLSGVTLADIDLRNADLSGADLSDSTISGNLVGADLTGANVSGTDFTDAFFADDTGIARGQICMGSPP